MTKINCGHWLFDFRYTYAWECDFSWWKKLIKKNQSSAYIYICVGYLFWLNCFRNKILYFKYFFFWICIKVEIIIDSIVTNYNVNTQISQDCFIIYNKRSQINIWKSNIFTMDRKCYERKIPSIKLISHSNEGISREIVEASSVYSSRRVVIR